MPVVKRYATYEDLEAVPDTMVAELIDGDLVTSPRPASPHARATTQLGSTLVGLDGERWIVASTHGGDEPITAEPFDALALDPSRWWLEPEAGQPIG